METATFAMGCFWEPQLLFDNVPGVKKTTVGYTGGNVDEPTYHQVSTGDTGHAEAVQVEFDPKKVSYDDLLKIFWEHHNPTTKNRQGPDVGSNYRSAIYFHSAQQKEAAEKTLKEQQEKYDKPITTEIQESGPFYKAEDYHQDYLKKRGQTSCSV